MKTVHALVLSLVPTLLSSPSEAGAAQVAVGGQTFTVPDGFTVERVAATNLAPRPVSASVDDQGRLYVTDSSGSNLPPSEQLKNPTHRLLRLEDVDGDGRYDRSVVFADRVMFPQGCLWHAGSVYVAAPPSIWKFTDADGDGVAERREEWFKGGTLTGCANDIHGPHLGPDGWIYWTKGAFAEQVHPLGNGRTMKDAAAHILRARPDGTGLEVVMTGGMDNPVEVAFTAEGEAVFTSTFIDFSQPGWRDGVGHAAYGAVFGKENGVLDDGRVQRPGPDLTHPFVQFGAGAPSGLCRYESGAFGPGYRDNLFASTFNLHKITRHQLRLAGATYASTDSDFLVSDSLDFHPTDVLEDADGSLLIVDTGGWYKLCCPSSQLAKADVLGGIYRVRRADQPRLTGAALTAARRGRAGSVGLSGDSTVTALRRLAWTGPASEAGDKVGRFRAVLRDEAQAAVTNPGAAHRVRLAAEGLGRLGQATTAAAGVAWAKDVARELYRAIAAVAGRDEVLERALIQALIDLGSGDGVAAAARAALEAKESAVQRAALVVLDQAGAGSVLAAADVLPRLASADAALRRVAAWIAERHADWGTELAGSFRSRLAGLGAGGGAGAGAGADAELVRQLGRFARNAAVQGVLASVAADGAAGALARRAALRAMGEAGLKDVPAAWVTALVPALGATGDGAADVRRQAVLTARAWSSAKPGAGGAWTELAAALEGAGRDASWARELRLEALAAVPGGLASVDPSTFQLLVGAVAATEPVAVRSAAVAALVKAKLGAGQLGELAEAVRTVGPLELGRLLPVFDQAPGEELGQRLLASLKTSKGVSGLRPDVLRPRLAGYPESVRAGGEALLASLNTDAGRQAARLDALLAEVKGRGDIRRGQAIFNSAKAACSACHAIGYLGGKVGPDLTRISEVRNERDLLEAIVYPSASFVRSYEPMILTTRGGDEHSGVLRKDGADEVVLATGPQAEVRVARADIAEMRPGTVSVMPQGLDEQLTREELADLLAFLRNTRWGAR